MIYKNINISECTFSFVSEEMAKEYIDYRIAKKKALTQGAFNRAMKAASRCTECSPDEAIEITIDKGWDGVTPEYISAELARRFDAAINTKMIISKPVQLPRKSIEENLVDKSWAN